MKTHRARWGLATLTLLCLGPYPAAGTRFWDVRGADNLDAGYQEDLGVELFYQPVQLQILIPRPESLPPGGEMAVFNQSATVTYDTEPSADIEDRSQWYTRLVWLEQSLDGVSSVQVRATVQVQATAIVQGLGQDLSILPGDYYTDYTQTVQYVPGISDAVHHIEETQDQVRGMPTGNLGLAHRWAAYMEGVLQRGSCPTGGIDDAAWVWANGVADCDGFSNVFASGMRTLGIPTCVILGYVGLAASFHDLWPVTFNVGLHAWSGVWSEGENAFIPFDVGMRYLGFVPGERVHVAYHEDLSNHFVLVWTPESQAQMQGVISPGNWTAQGLSYDRIRVRRLDDGFGDDDIMFCNEVTGLHAPGGTTGVLEPDSIGADELRLLVTSPFHEALSASVIAARPARVTVEVFDVQGRRMACLAEDRAIGAGESFFRWLPGDAPPGVYFVRVAAKERPWARTGKAVRIR